jgi:hypothetical protein
MFHFFSLLRKSNLKNAFALFLMLTPMVIYAGQNLKKYEAGSPTSDRLSVTVTCQVTLSSGESPEGALLTLTGVNNPALYHEQYAPESGEVIFAGVIEANYRFRAVLQGYYELDTLITILDNLHIPVFLQEIMNNPRNLSIDSLSLCVRWQAPVPVYAELTSRQHEIMKTGNKTPGLQSKKSGAFSGKRSFTGYGVFLDGELVGNTPDTSFVFEPLVYGQSYLAGVAAIYSSGYSEQDTCRFTSRFLFPPRNTTGEIPIMTDYGHITWEAPEDPQNPGQPVPGLTGYKIYRNHIFLAEVTLETPEYYDMELIPGTTIYEIRAVYELTAYGYPGEYQESAPGEGAELIWHCCLNLPFTENFNTGLFQTNNWTVEGDNWRISGQVGNDAPSVEFYFSPVNVNYSMSLTSDFIIGTDFIDGNIMLDFDLKHTLVNATEDEKLKVEVFNGSEWVEVVEYVNNESLYWEPRSIDITESAKGNIFRVRFTAHGRYTTDIFNWIIDNIHVYKVCAPPTDLLISYNFPNIHEVILTWESPEPSYQNGLIGWDNGTNHNAFGMESGGIFHVAVRFTPTQLAQYVGTSLTKIRMFPNSPGGSIILKVWKGAQAGMLVHSQPVSAYIPGQWNEFELNVPVLVDGTSELWFGYEVTHTGNNNVAGHDDGSAVAGFGDMISLNGTDWESMATVFDLNFNWNLQGYVEGYVNDGSGKYLGAENEMDNLHSLKPLNELEKEKIKNLYDRHSKREVQSYYIYREGELIATTDTTYYIADMSGLPGGYYCFTTTAVYNDCESESTEEFCIPYGIPISISYQEIQNLAIYPNPSTGLFYVDAEGLEGKLSVYSFSGKHLLETPISKNEKPVLSLEHFPVGAYLVKFVADSGETFTGKVIVTR